MSGLTAVERGEVKRSYRPFFDKDFLSPVKAATWIYRGKADRGRQNCTLGLYELNMFTISTRYNYTLYNTIVHLESRNW